MRLLRTGTILYLMMWQRKFTQGIFSREINFKLTIYEPQRIQDRAESAGSIRRRIYGTQQIHFLRLKSQERWLRRALRQHRSKEWKKERIYKLLSEFDEGDFKK